jgi:DNA processing protein
MCSRGSSVDDRRRLLALCAIRIEGRSIDWSLLAREAQLWQGLDRLESGRFQEESRDAEDGVPLLGRGLVRIDEARARVDQELAIAERAGARLVTVLDDDYPATLRAIFNLPPFLGRRRSHPGRGSPAAAARSGRSLAANGGARRALR